MAQIKIHHGFIIERELNGWAVGLHHSTDAHKEYSTQDDTIAFDSGYLVFDDQSTAQQYADAYKYPTDVSACYWCDGPEGFVIWFPVDM